MGKVDAEIFKMPSGVQQTIKTGNTANSNNCSEDILNQPCVNSINETIRSEVDLQPHLVNMQGRNFIRRRKGIGLSALQPSFQKDHIYNKSEQIGQDDNFEPLDTGSLNRHKIKLESMHAAVAQYLRLKSESDNERIKDQFMENSRAAEAMTQQMNQSRLSSQMSPGGTRKTNHEMDPKMTKIMKLVHANSVVTTIHWEVFELHRMGPLMKY